MPLQVDYHSTLVLGIHLGPRTTGVVLMGLDGKERAAVLVPHAGMGPGESIELVVSAAEKLIDAHAGRHIILGTGIATGGIVDREPRASSWITRVRVGKTCGSWTCCGAGCPPP